MLNYIYGTPLSYNNPVALPVAYNYITGVARGIDMSIHSGGFSGQMPTTPCITKSYNFTGGSSSSLFSGCNSTPYIPKQYHFGGSSDGNLFSGCGASAYVPKQYHFTGELSTGLFSASGTPYVPKQYNFGGSAYSNSTSPSSSTTPKTKNDTTNTSTTSSSNNVSKTSKPSSTKTTKTTKATEPTKTNDKPEIKQPGADLRKEFVSIAYNYYGDNEADGSSKKFCKDHNCPNEGEWCTDFVSYVVKQAYKLYGKQLPRGFGNHDVEELKKWAIRNGYFVRTSNLKNHGRDYIQKNIKMGDIIILNENGASHTGFVTNIGKDGTIHTIEGNRDDRVTIASYSPGSKEYDRNLSGFIQLC